jgi:hypothetical protein
VRKTRFAKVKEPAREQRQAILDAGILTPKIHTSARMGAPTKTRNPLWVKDFCAIY